MATEGPQLLKRVAAEAMGTFMLVVIGCGAILVDARTGGALGTEGVAVAFGAAVAAAILAFGNTSGAHINPAVTVAFWFGRQFPGREVAPYVVAQCAGGILGALTLRGLFGPVVSLSATVPRLSLGGAFLLEVLVSFLLMFVIAAVARSGGQRAAPWLVGLAVTIDAYLAGPFTGASMNPARSLGPAVAASVWDAHWLYWAAPILGMLAASRTVEFFDPTFGQVVGDSRGEAWGVEGRLEEPPAVLDRAAWLECAEVSARCVSVCEAHADQPTAKPCAEASRRCASLCSRMADAIHG